MANLTTIARPYAKAILQLAQQNNAYEQWRDTLDFLASLAQDPLGRELMINRTVAAQRKAEFICSLKPELLFNQAQNLVKLLAQNKRLLILPALYELYEAMRKKALGIVTVELTLAQPMPVVLDSHAETVNLLETVDPQLLGGGVAKIDNRVVDASIRGRLIAMREQLRQ